MHGYRRLRPISHRDKRASRYETNSTDKKASRVETYIYYDSDKASQMSHIAILYSSWCWISIIWLENSVMANTLCNCVLHTLGTLVLVCVVLILCKILRLEFFNFEAQCGLWMTKVELNKPDDMLLQWYSILIFLYEIKKNLKWCAKSPIVFMMSSVFNDTNFSYPNFVYKCFHVISSSQPDKVPVVESQASHISSLRLT